MGYVVKKIIVILSLLLIAVPALAAERQRSEDGMRPEMQNAVELDLTTWREEPVPELWSEKWREANQGREYYVFEHNGKLMVSDYRPGSNFEFCFDNGCFSGINKGEFGGELWFQPNGGVKYRILYGNPVAVFVLNGKYVPV